MNNLQNVKSNLNPTTAINPAHSDIESYLYATDDYDRYSDFLADKSRLEADLKSQHLFAISA